MEAVSDMKGQIPILEMIAVIVILFISFSIFFPERNYGNRWEDAEILLKGRDIVVTMDRTGNLSTYASDASAFQAFMGRALPERNLIFWNALEGTVQNRITVACNCTTQQINDLSTYVGRMRLNDRDIQIDFVASTLSPIQSSNVLLIYGGKDLAPYRNEILNYLRSGNGVVGIANFNSASNEKPDAAYTEIFGIRDCRDVPGSGNCNGNGDDRVTFLQPSSSSQVTYQPHKIFFHVPIRSIVASGTSPLLDIPYENASMPGCADVARGYQPFQVTFSFRSVDANYWICNTTTAYFDTNQNNRADAIVKVNDTFAINGYNFNMRYIDLNRTFVAFRSGFEFDDWRNADLRVLPSDLDNSKVLQRDGVYSSGLPMPVVVANGSSYGMTMWGGDFLAGLPVRHDERLLVASMLMASSSKRSNDVSVIGSQTGFSIPYIHVANRDMMEIYQFNLGLGFPF